ncbi:MAG: hypothetical protein KIG88_06210 [Weeksellaceae bacterium]|nr:hypothetical protein [Weeksellaceae bacterium]
MNTELNVWFKRITYAVIMLFIGGFILAYLTNDLRYSNLRWMYIAGRMIYFLGLFLGIIIGILNSVFIAFVSNASLKLKLSYFFLSLLPLIIFLILTISIF